VQSLGLSASLSLFIISKQPELEPKPYCTITRTQVPLDGGLSKSFDLAEKKVLAKKAKGGFGFTITGGLAADDDAVGAAAGAAGIFLREVTGKAARDSGLVAGMQLISVDGTAPASAAEVTGLLETKTSLVSEQKLECSGSGW
jgi:hypothetical protein